MPNKTLNVNKDAFNELCQYVCYQISPSGSKTLDRKTLDFAVYWQICVIFGCEIDLSYTAPTRNIAYTELLQNMVDRHLNDSFNVAEIIEQTVNKCLKSSALMVDGFRG